MVSAVACGKAHSIAVSERGRMFTWGLLAFCGVGEIDETGFCEQFFVVVCFHNWLFVLFLGVPVVFC